jgi:hypothetical protein
MKAEKTSDFCPHPHATLQQKTLTDTFVSPTALFSEISAIRGKNDGCLNCCLKVKGNMLTITVGKLYNEQHQSTGSQWWYGTGGVQAR